MVRFKKIGGQIISGAERVAKETDKGLKRYDDWAEKRTNKRIKKQKRTLKDLDLKIKIAKRRAELRAQKPQAW